MTPIEKRFAYHKPDAKGLENIRQIRGRFVALASWAADTLPEGREKALALTALQDAMMWANAAEAMTWEAVEEPVKVQ